MSSSGGVAQIITCWVDRDGCRIMSVEKNGWNILHLSELQVVNIFKKKTFASTAKIVCKDQNLLIFCIHYGILNDNTTLTFNFFVPNEPFPNPPISKLFWITPFCCIYKAV